MHADLVRPACLEAALDQRCFAQNLQPSPMGYGSLAATAFDYRNLLAVGRRPRERGVEDAFRRLWNAVHEGEIAPLDAMRRELLRQPLVRYVRLCDEEQPRSVLVDPVDDAGIPDRLPPQ